MREQTNFEKSIRINDLDDNGVWIRSTRTLRQLVGVLGIALPLLLIIFSPNCSNPIESISHYYYTRSGTFLSVILSLVGIFLIIYTKDFILSSIAGFFALCVVFFPTSQLADSCSVSIIPRDSLREGFHYFSAVVFLVILTFMTLFHFTKPDDEEIIMKQSKVKYKRLYQTCGIIMLLALMVVGIRMLGIDSYNIWYDELKLTFWMEVVALEAFGIAWLVKGRSTVKASEFWDYQRNME